MVLPNDVFAVRNIQKEAQFYSIQGLVSVCDEFIADVDDKIEEAETVTPKCVITVLTSATEESALINQSNKPVIKLLYNRSNNKYSYTKWAAIFELQRGIYFDFSQSDDNMLKNIELFDKLVSRFRGRILFLKDINGEDICVWSFFGNKRKISEICCTSIVYTTEKKQTKGMGQLWFFF